MIFLVMINSEDLNEFKKSIEKLADEFANKTNRFFKLLVDEEKIDFLAKK